MALRHPDTLWGDARAMAGMQRWDETRGRGGGWRSSRTAGANLPSFEVIIH